ncbi:hypothetical protein ACFE04_005768 [Oxalis oulophora]
MPPPSFMSNSRAITSLISRKNRIRPLINNNNTRSSLLDYHHNPRFTHNHNHNHNHNPPTIITPNFSPSTTLYNNINSSIIQKRYFLGFGDGEETNCLSKVYEERRIMGYSPEQLFDVVAAVDLYRDFLPWCQRSDIIKYYPDGSFDAELEIGFKFLVESYISHVELTKPNYIKTTASNSYLFDHLINIWEFNPGPTPGTCNLYFLVDFKFNSPLYTKVATMFFKEVVSKLVGSFSDHCALIYGPGVPVPHQNTYR